MTAVPATDVHQHLWPEPLRRGARAAATAAAPAPARRLDRPSSPGSRPSRSPPGAGDPAARAAGLRGRRRRPGAPRAVVPARASRRSPPDEARPLLDAWHDGVLGAGARVRRLGRARARRRRPRRRRRACSTAGPSASPSPPARSRRPSASSPGGPCSRRSSGAARRCSSTPGPGPRTAARRGATPRPAWWPALTGYVAALQAAWLAWAGWGRAAHPRLRVVFAAARRAAPLHAERLAARGGPAGAVHDPLVFYDTSSYGHRAVDAMVARRRDRRRSSTAPTAPSWPRRPTTASAPRPTAR